MRIYAIPFFCLFLAACSAPPKLEYPTGANRVPINQNLTQPTKIETISISPINENSAKAAPKNSIIKESF